ncbi:MAG: sn-glycerol-3-phosphate ABC transporter ATP-binding protein UgpC [Myxococcota bacterium]
MASLSLRGIQKSFGETTVLRGVDIEAEDGEFVVLVGPSGCGKSTLLRTIAGLEMPTAGEVHIGDRDVTRLPPKDRDIAMVFQSYALYPHLTVRKNLAFGLSLRKTDPATITARVNEVAESLGLGALLDRYPRQLSGGQRQRVAMGRAIARRPQLFLFDEPLSNLDAALRTEVRIEIKKLHADLGATMVYVTHDQVEAMTLADRLVILNEGRVEQMGPPLALYNRPATRFVGAFMGSPSMNFLPGNATDKGLQVGDANLGMVAHRGEVEVGIRPQDLRLDDDGSLKIEVEVVEAMGFETYAHGRLGRTPFVARLDGSTTPAPGSSLTLAPALIHLFDPPSGRVLGPPVELDP